MDSQGEFTAPFADEWVLVLCNDHWQDSAQVKYEINIKEKGIPGFSLISAILGLGILSIGIIRKRRT